jgi:hypothetical protein
MLFKKRILLLSALIFPFSIHGQEIRDTQDELVSWIETKKAIAEVQAEWRSQEAIILDLIQLMELEKEEILASIEMLKEGSSEAEKVRTELNSERQKLIAATESLQTVVPNLEAKTREIVERLPEPLIAELAPLVRRLPKAGESSKLGVSQRLLTVVGILNKIDKFNGGISISSDIRQVGDTTSEVRTIYFGLAGAFFTNESGDYAGVGLPSASGWEWTAKPELGEKISQLVGVYEGAREATFVTLPIEIR